MNEIRGKIIKKNDGIIGHFGTGIIDKSKYNDYFECPNIALGHAEYTDTFTYTYKESDE